MVFSCYQIYRFIWQQQKQFIVINKADWYIRIKIGRNAPKCLYRLSLRYWWRFPNSPENIWRSKSDWKSFQYVHLLAMVNFLFVATTWLLIRSIWCIPLGVFHWILGKFAYCRYRIIPQCIYIHSSRKMVLNQADNVRQKFHLEILLLIGLRMCNDS